MVQAKKKRHHQQLCVLPSPRGSGASLLPRRPWPTPPKGWRAGAPPGGTHTGQRPVGRAVRAFLSALLLQHLLCPRASACFLPFFCTLAACSGAAGRSLLALLARRAAAAPSP